MKGEASSPQSEGQNRHQITRGVGTIQRPGEMEGPASPKGKGTNTAQQAGSPFIIQLLTLWIEN